MITPLVAAAADRFAPVAYLTKGRTSWSAGNVINSPSQTSTVSREPCYQAISDRTPVSRTSSRASVARTPSATSSVQNERLPAPSTSRSLSRDSFVDMFGRAFQTPSGPSVAEDQNAGPSWLEEALGKSLDQLLDSPSDFAHISGSEPLPAPDAEAVQRLPLFTSASPREALGATGGRWSAPLAASRPGHSLPGAGSLAAQVRQGHAGASALAGAGAAAAATAALASSGQSAQQPQAVQDRPGAQKIVTVHYQPGERPMQELLRLDGGHGASVTVEEVAEGSKAKMAGVKKGSALIQMNGREEFKQLPGWQVRLLLEAPLTLTFDLSPVRPTSSKCTEIRLTYSPRDVLGMPPKKPLLGPQDRGCVVEEVVFMPEVAPWPRSYSRDRSLKHTPSFDTNNTTARSLGDPELIDSSMGTTHLVGELQRGRRQTVPNYSRSSSEQLLAYGFRADADHEVADGPPQRRKRRARSASLLRWLACGVDDCFDDDDYGCDARWANPTFAEEDPLKQAPAASDQYSRQRGNEHVAQGGPQRPTAVVAPPQLHRVTKETRVFSADWQGCLPRVAAASSRQTVSAQVTPVSTPRTSTPRPNHCNSGGHTSHLATGPVVQAAGAPSSVYVQPSHGGNAQSGPGFGNTLNLTIAASAAAAAAEVAASRAVTVAAANKTAAVARERPPSVRGPPHERDAMRQSPRGGVPAAGIAQHGTAANAWTVPHANGSAWAQAKNEQLSRMGGGAPRQRSRPTRENNALPGVLRQRL